jgi:hypothetical protein
MTAYFGPSIWQFEIFDIRLQAIFVFLGTIGLVLALFRNALYAAHWPAMTTSHNVANQQG